MKPRTIVVGNGPCLLGSELGEEIDSFDNVVRVNNFLTSGYERHAGAKIDTWCTTVYHNVFRDRAKTIEASGFLMPFNNWPISGGWARSEEFLKETASDRGLELSSPNEQMIRSLAKELGGLASSGMTALNYYLNTEGSVAAAGFDFFKAASHHYYNPDETRHSSCPHRGDAEQEWFSKKETSGEIDNLHSRDLTSYLISQYAKLHSDSPSYGRHNNIHPKAIEWARGRKLSSILDYGCGKGVLVRQLREYGFAAEGYDPAIPDYQKAPSLRKFQGVCCTDVLEHIPEDAVPGFLRTIGSLAEKTIFLNISTRPAVIKLPDGRNCHETVKPLEWWRESLKDNLGDFRIAHDHDLGDEYLAVLVAKS